MRLLYLSVILLLPRHATAVPVTGGSRPGQREVIPASAGPNRLDLDEEAVAATALGIRTLRLHDAAGVEVPWLAIPSVPGPEHWSRARSILALRETKESSGFEADLGAIAEISAINVEGLPAPLLKRFRLEGSGDRQRWTVLVGEGTLFDLPDDGLRQTRVDFEPGAWRYVRMSWDDRSSARAGRPTAVWARRVVGAPAEIVLKVPAVMEVRPSEPGMTRLHVRLPGKNLPLRAMELEASQPHVLREAHVTMPTLGEAGLRPMPMGEGTLRRNESDGVVAADMRLPLVGLVTADSIDIAIEDGDNPPLRDLGVTLELGPLPWIYFEAPAAAPLIASFDPEAQEPSYDLEAARAEAESSRPPRAKWGAWRVRVERPALPPVMPLAGAPLDASAYEVARAIPAMEPGLVSLLLDADVLARSHDLMDVRIVDAAGRQVPYISEERDEPLSMSLPPLAPWPDDASDPADARLSRYRVELPRAGLPTSRLVLRTTARVFDRTVRVVVMRPPPDPRSRPWRDELAQATWLSGDPDEVAPALALELPSVDATLVMLEIDEGDNAPLPLDAPELLLPHRRVRFSHPGGDGLRLVYGNAEVPPPRYDLSLLRSTVIAAPASDIELTTASAPIAETKRAGGQKILLWAILGATIVALLVVLARLVKREA